MENFTTFRGPGRPNDVESVLTDIDADYGGRSVELLRHGVLLVFGAPCQHSMLAGREHDRTIPLAEVNSYSSPPSAMASSEFETTRPLSCIRFLLSERWLSLCVTGEDKVARFGLIVAGEAGFHERSVGRFAVLEVSETPTASRGVLLCILDHKLNVRWSAGYERLGLAKDFVVFLRRHVTVV